MNGLIALLQGVALLFAAPTSDSLSAFADACLQPVPEIRMISFGDLILDRDILSRIEKHGVDYPLGEFFAHPFFEEKNYDLISVNLEGPFYDTLRRRDFFPQFAFPTSLAQDVLSAHGINFVTLSNNHTWDHALKGWESTLKTLDEQNIAHVGHPKNRFEDDIYVYEQYGYSIAFLGITDVLKVFPVDWEETKERIAELDAQNDVVVVMAHWGKEFETSSSLRQQDKAHGLIEAGADLIIGHHPHVVQEHEYFQGKAIYYSLGNFVFDQYFSEEVQKGLGLDIRFQLDGDIHIEEVPIRLELGKPRIERVKKEPKSS